MVKMLPILISEHGFKAAAMQVELDDISGAEAEGRLVLPE